MISNKESFLREFNEYKLTSKSDKDTVIFMLKSVIAGTQWDGKVSLVGGAVRDEIMGLVPDDLDFIVEGSLTSGIEFSEWLAIQLRVYSIESNPQIFPRFGTSSLKIGKSWIGLPNLELQFVSPRKEIYSIHSRKPLVEPGTLMDEVLRRDFTINSLLRNVTTGVLLDLTGRGISDIHVGIIKTCDLPLKIYSDDPLRMLRAIRFSAKYNFTIENESWQAIPQNASRIVLVSDERIQSELNKILISNHSRKGLMLLWECKLMKHILPELALCYNMTQNKYHTDDVFDHILEVVELTEPDLISRLIALFHDIGKLKTRTVDETGDVHFYEHEKVGAKMTKEIMFSLRYPQEIIDKVVLGVRYHMAMKHTGDECNVSNKTLRKFLNSVEPILDNLLNVIHADNISHSEEGSMPMQVTRLLVRIAEFKAAGEETVVKLPIDGNDIMKMGIPAGPRIKAIKDAITEAWFENPDMTRDDALKIVQVFLEPMDTC